MKQGSEAAFQQQIEQLAKFYGWTVYHAPDNRPSARTGRVQRVTAGFPDLVMVRPPELIFAELKNAKGRTSPEQLAWLSKLTLVADHVNPTQPRHIDVYLWRPDNFDEINARLARGRRLENPLWAMDTQAALDAEPEAAA